MINGFTRTHTPILASLVFITLSACGGSGSDNGGSPFSTEQNMQGAMTDPEPASPPPTTVTSTNPMESLVGLDVTLTTTSAISIPLNAGEFATDGDVTRTYPDDTNMFARTIAQNARNYRAAYSYDVIDANTSRETANLIGGQT